MPLPTTRNPGSLITTVGGVHPVRIAMYANSIAALQVRTAARHTAQQYSGNRGEANCR